MLTDEQFAGWVETLLSRVESGLTEVVAPQREFVREAAQYLVQAGGKRFRPALTIAAGGLTSKRVDEKALVDSAVVVELTHVASLYHDDVMDEATLRRGAESPNRRWGNQVAIMVGDYLLAMASLVGSSLGEDFIAFQARTLARLVQGQIAELRGPEPGEDPIAHYFGVLADKTGSLIAASARGGGMVAGLAADQIEELTLFGEELGIVFQMTDDLIDILSDDSGKQKGTDLREGILTLAPLLIVTQKSQSDERLRQLLAGPVSQEDLEEALRLLRVHPAVDEVRRDIAVRSEAAKARLSGFEDSPARRALLALVDQVVVRTA